MLASKLIERKRDGDALSEGEIRDLFLGFLDGRVPDYQMAAFLMAVVHRGMEAGELAALMEVMLGSGATLRWTDDPRPVADKHSTGGVGDKVSLVLAPLAAVLGLRVPMMSGRGLGHTTGTLDKLESIPGFRTDLPLPEFQATVDRLGVGMIGPTSEIAPLDRRLYALRSVTGTVPAIPLIATSIMSKKLAEGLGTLLLDVKVGNGAFLPEPERARELARVMVGLGAGRGVRTVALLTAMDRPLGRAAGNALEVVEAVACLSGGGPADLRSLVLTQAEVLMEAAGVEGGRARAEEALDSGRALERFSRMVEAQGGDPRVAEDPGAVLDLAPARRTVQAPASGTVGAIATRRIGEGILALGGGRRRLGEDPDLGVGFTVDVKPGDALEAGQPLGTVWARDGGGLDLGENVLRDAIPLVQAPGRPDPPLPLVVDRIDPAG